MPLVVAGFAAIVALAAGILAHVDPLASLSRAGIAFVLGWVAGSVWHAFTTTWSGAQTESEPTPASEMDSGSS